jgi:predicted ATPase
MRKQGNMLHFAQRAALEANDLLKEQAVKIKEANERAELALHKAGAEAAAAAAATDAVAALEGRLLHLGEQVAQLSATAMTAEEVTESETAAMASEALEAAAADVAEAKAAASDAADQYAALIDMLLDENNLLHRELRSGGQVLGENGAEVPSVSRGVERVAPLKVCAQIPGAGRDFPGDCLRIGELDRWILCYLASRQEVTD